MDIILVPRIRERRMEAHMTQKDLAEKTEINISQLSKIENGKNFPLPPLLWRIARGIGCTVDELYEVSE